MTLHFIQTCPDHNKPKSRLAKDELYKFYDLDNLCLRCRSCNSKKGHNELLASSWANGKHPNTLIGADANASVDCMPEDPRMLGAVVGMLHEQDGISQEEAVLAVLSPALHARSPISLQMTPGMLSTSLQMLPEVVQLCNSYQGPLWALHSQRKTLLTAAANAAIKAASPTVMEQAKMTAGTVMLTVASTSSWLASWWHASNDAHDHGKH